LEFDDAEEWFYSEREYAGLEITRKTGSDHGFVKVIKIAL